MKYLKIYLLLMKMNLDGHIQIYIQEILDQV